MSKQRLNLDELVVESFSPAEKDRGARANELLASNLNSCWDTECGNTYCASSPCAC